MTQRARHAGRSRLANAIVALVCLIPFLATVAYGAVDSLAIGVIFVLTVIIAILWFGDSLLSGEFRYASHAIQLPIVGLLILGFVQLLPLRANEAAAEIVGSGVAHSLSLDPYATRFFLIHLTVYLLFFAAALVYVPGDERPKRIAIGIVALGAGLAFFGIIQWLGMPDAIYGLRATPQAIPFGPYVNQHHFAALMEMTSGVALGLLFGAGIGRERKLFIALAAGVMGMSIVFTGSRGGIIGYLFVVAFAAVASFVRSGGKHRDDPDVSERRVRNLFVIAAAGGLVVIVFGSVLFLGGQDALLRGIGLNQAQTDVTSGRMHFWGIAWKVFLEHPIIGTGLDSFGVAFTRFDTWNGFFRVEQAHNDYLQILADGGIVGFACVLAFIVLLSMRGIPAIADRRPSLRRSIVTGAFAGCMGILIHSFFDFPLRTPANALVFLLLVVLVVGNSGERSSHRSD